MKKTFALILALQLFCATISCAFSEMEFQPRSSDCFQSCSVVVSAGSNGKVHITFRAIGKGACSTLGVSYFQVEQLIDGRWTPVTGYIDGETGSNVVTYTFSRTYYGYVGETYRVNAFFLGVLDGQADNCVVTSGSVEASD